MTARRLIPFAVLTALLTACGGSPPVRYHSLGLPAAVDGGAAERLVELLPVVLPGRADRAALVLTDAAGHPDVREDNRWVAPLADEVRAVLTDALWRTARAADVYAAPLPRAAGGRRNTGWRCVSNVSTRFPAMPRRWKPRGCCAVCRAVSRAPLSGRAAEDAAAALAEATRTLTARIARTLIATGCPE